MNEEIYDNISNILQEAVKRHHEAVETFVLKELSKRGYNWDSYELRNMFIRQRLKIYIKDGANYLYLDDHELITSWRDTLVFDETKMGWCYDI